MTMNTAIKEAIQQNMSGISSDDFLYESNYNDRYILHLNDLANQTSFNGTNDINIKSAKKTLEGIDNVISRNKFVRDNVRIDNEKT